MMRTNMKPFFVWSVDANRSFCLAYEPNYSILEVYGCYSASLYSTDSEPLSDSSITASWLFFACNSGMLSGVSSATSLSELLSELSGDFCKPRGESSSSSLLVLPSSLLLLEPDSGSWSESSSFPSRFSPLENSF